MTVSSNLFNLPIKIRFRIEDDTTPEVMEQFVLEVTDVHLVEVSLGTTMQVLVNNSVTVAIGDNDGKYVHLFSFAITCFFLNFKCSNKCRIPGSRILR